MIIDLIFGIIGILIMLAIFAAIGVGTFFLVKKIFGLNISKKDAQDAIHRCKDSLFSRVVFAFILVLISFIPLQFVGDLVSERSNLYQNVSSRMTEEWGGHQRITGPILSIPYEYTSYVMDKVENKKTGEITHIKRAVTETKDLHIMPENLNIKTKLETRELTRGIYTVPIYDSTHIIAGEFKWPDLSVLTKQPDKILWEKATVSFLISSTRGITGGTNFIWNNIPINLSSGTGINGLDLQGVHARLKLTNSLKSTPASFKLSLNLRGSKGLDYAPTGRNSKISIEANWPHPSFEGKLLPSDRVIDEAQFSAQWDATHLSRTYGQLISLGTSAKKPFFNQVNNFNFGVNLFQSINLYTLLDRTIKYGVMFITLTFVTIFVLEFISGIRFHWLQHLIIGGALSMFYLCTLAFSEHIDFAYAYLIGMGLIAFMLGIYTWFVMKKPLYGIGISSVMISLYTVLYSILQMEDYALLIGTVLLLFFLALSMFATRKLHEKNT